jgi:hypothetical protein
VSLNADVDAQKKLIVGDAAVAAAFLGTVYVFIDVAARGAFLDNPLK